jgi:hypothetical protein
MVVDDYASESEISRICIGIKFAFTNVINCIPASTEKMSTEIIAVVDAFLSNSNLPFSYDC